MIELTTIWRAVMDIANHGSGWPGFLSFLSFFFFFNDTATTEIYTLSLHDALPISIWVPPIWNWFPMKSEASCFTMLCAKPQWILLSLNIFLSIEIGRAHVWTPVTQWSRMPSSAWKKKKKYNNTNFTYHHDNLRRNKILSTQLSIEMRGTSIT